MKFKGLGHPGESMWNTNTRSLILAGQEMTPWNIWRVGVGAKLRVPRALDAPITPMQSGNVSAITHHTNGEKLLQLTKRFDTSLAPLEYKERRTFTEIAYHSVLRLSVSINKMTFLGARPLVVVPKRESMPVRRTFSLLKTSGFSFDLSSSTQKTTSLNDSTVRIVVGTL